MVVIGGYMNFCICALDEEATIQAYVDIYDRGEALRHVCKTSLEQWRNATGITEDQEKSFVADKVFPRKAQFDCQRLEEDAAKERSICCIFLPTPGNGKSSKFEEFLKASNTLNTSVFKLESSKNYTHADRRMIKEKVMEHKPKAIYLPNLVAWIAWQREEYDAMPLGTKAGWQKKKFGDETEFAGADVFIGPAWSTPGNHQEKLWKLFGDWVARQQQSVTEESQTSPPATLTAPRKRQAPGSSTSRHSRRRLR